MIIIKELLMYHKKIVNVAKKRSEVITMFSILDIIGILPIKNR